jgi:hypothetical protein
MDDQTKPDPSHVHLKAEALAEQPLRFELPIGGVAPFPRARFLAFLSRLKVQSKDTGLSPFRLLGSQVYLLDEIERALAAGITTIYVLKSRQVGISTLLLAAAAVPAPPIICTRPRRRFTATAMRWRNFALR